MYGFLHFFELYAKSECCQPWSFSDNGGLLFVGLEALQQLISLIYRAAFDECSAMWNLNHKNYALKRYIITLPSVCQSTFCPLLFFHVLDAPYWSWVFNSVRGFWADCGVFGQEGVVGQSPINS